MMTRQDYRKIAAAIQQVLNDVHPAVRPDIEQVAVTVADSLADDNPRFDRVRFYVACGMQERANQELALRAVIDMLRS